MNTVMTAEYVVLEELAPTLLADKINHYSQLGYRLTHFASIPATDILDQYYNAVMVREPRNAAIARDFIGHFMVLAARVEALESKQNYYLKRIEELEKQVNDITDKIDWSK